MSRFFHSIFTELQHFFVYSYEQCVYYFQFWHIITLYQILVRGILSTIIWFLYNYGLIWIRSTQEGSQYFLTDTNILQYIDIEKAILLACVIFCVFLVSISLEYVGILSCSRQYRQGKKIRFSAICKDIVRVTPVFIGVLFFKIVFFIGFTGMVILLLFLLYNITPFYVWIFIFVMGGVFLLYGLCKFYLDTAYTDQKCFEKHRNIFHVFSYNLSYGMKVDFLKFTLGSTLLFGGLASLGFFILLYALGWSIVLIDISVIGALLLTSSIILSALVITTFFSFFIPVFMALRSTSKYLEYTGEAKKAVKKGKKSKRRGNIIRFLVYSSIGIFYSLTAVSLYDLMHTEIKTPDIIGHRGSMIGYPENTLPALDYAIDNGAKYAEIDVQLTQDNKVVVFHDMSYFDGKVHRYVINTPLDTMLEHRLSDEKGEALVSDLESFLQHAKGNIILNIELKHTQFFEKELVREVYLLLEKYEMEESVIISSLEYSLLEEWKKYNTETELGLIITGYFGNFELLDTYEVDWLILNNIFYDMFGAFIEEHVDKKIALWGFSTNGNIIENYIGEDAIELQVDAVIVDDPKITSEIYTQFQEQNEVDKFLYKIFWNFNL